ncbi:hypothetical protein D0911_02765 [Zhongshania marina]|uniref:Uncharacterized protein n=1 Tax=Zhongshania marina TaxID=2304603 RepID=A0ABX9W691_9GAMM|nr:hypothetical protein D0911_02765 [Zhongshania marina]
MLSLRLLLVYCGRQSEVGCLTKKKRASLALITLVINHFPTSDFRLPTSDFRLPTSDFRLPTSDFRLPTSDFRLPTSDFRQASPLKGSNPP